MSMDGHLENAVLILNEQKNPRKGADACFPHQERWNLLVSAVKFLCHLDRWCLMKLRQIRTRAEGCWSLHISSEFGKPLLPNKAKAEEFACCEWSVLHYCVILYVFLATSSLLAFCSTHPCHSSFCCRVIPKAMVSLLEVLFSLALM